MGSCNSLTIGDGEAKYVDGTCIYGKSIANRKQTDRTSELSIGLSIYCYRSFLSGGPYRAYNRDARLLSLITARKFLAILY